MYRNYLVIILSITFISIGKVENRMLLKLTGIACKNSAPKYTEITMCQLKAVKRDVSETSIRVTLLQKPFNNVTIKFKICKRGFEHQNPLIAFEIDACEFLRNKRRNPFASIFYGIVGITKYTNINHTCPYDHDIIVEKARFDGKGFESLPIPQGHYKFMITCYHLKIQLVHIDVVFQLIEK